MYCSDCRIDITDFNISEQTKYYVCPDCGELYETPVEARSLEECFSLFENENALELPVSYKRFISNGDVPIDFQIKAPLNSPKELAKYFDEGEIFIDQIFDVSPDGENSIFLSNYLISEWGLPMKLVLISGTGHSWIALDYRFSSGEPSVIFIESLSSSYVEIAKNFEELLEYEKNT